MKISLEGASVVRDDGRQEIGGEDVTDALLELHSESPDGFDAPRFLRVEVTVLDNPPR